MDRKLAEHFHQYLPSTAGEASQDRQQEAAATNFTYTAAPEARPTEWTFGPGPRQPQGLQQASYDSYGLPAFITQAPPHMPMSMSMSASGPPSSRLSLAPPPQNIYNHQDREPRTISNAENYYKIRQNLHQGVSVNQHSLSLTPGSSSVNQYTPAAAAASNNGYDGSSITQYTPAAHPSQLCSVGLYTPTPNFQTANAPSQNPHPAPVSQNAQGMIYPRQDNVASTDSPLTRIANGMLFDRQLPQVLPAQELGNTWQQQQQQVDRNNQLQTTRQQILPPFNLAGFTKHPTHHQAANSSSPAAAQVSSPTERVSFRRTANRSSTFQGYSEASANGEDVPQSQNSPGSLKYSTPSSTRPSNALALSHAPPLVQGVQLVSRHELPDRIRQVFPYELFNAVQSKCFPAIYHTNDNIVVSAPTGSGKTALLELAICRLVEGHRAGDFKIVYQAPTKSLCSERLRDWERKFCHLNLACAELTGDTSLKEMSKVRDASIIVTTPEKWDSITRKWMDHDKLVEMVKLFLIDEVHILKDTRGATLEAVVSRMKRRNPDVRFIALSATVPNSHDIAVWLGKGASNGHLPAHRETFGEDFRPVKLQKHVFGYDGASRNDFIFEKILDGKLPNLIQKYSRGKPIMVFCFTRRSCENTAAILAEWWTRQRVVDRAWPAPTCKIVVGSKLLQDLVGCGVAFHHAGLDAQDRLAVESGYLKGDINLICCTSTLAVGVNLPCHLVVLKGTVGFQDGILNEYADLEVMQMLGRAGRPQFDDTAIALIMTRQERSDRYNKMISGQDILESTLHLNLIEHLNSEVSLRTIHNLNSAKEWLKGTFLSVRMRQNPNHYKMEGVLETRDTDHRLELVCERDIKLLKEFQLVTDAEDFSCTEYGQAMSRYLIHFETMKLLLGIPRKAKTEEILQAICQASEFKDLRIKPVERPHLREFNKSPFMKYPIKENISTTTHKIMLIVQIQLGGIEYPNDKDFNAIRRQFTIDKGIIFDRINRLVRCVIDCKAFDCDAVATRNALGLARSLSAEYWENSNLQLRQVAGFGPAAVRKFANSDITSIDVLASKHTSDIERIMSKNPPYGRKLLDQLVGFPRLKLAASITKQTVKPMAKPKVNVLVVLSYQNSNVPVWKGKRPALTFIAETSGGTLVHLWRGNISRLEKNGFEIRFWADVSSPGEEISCHVACEEIVGTMRTTILKPAFPSSAFPAIPSARDGETARDKGATDTTDFDEFGSDDIEDHDFLEVASKADNSLKQYDKDDFEEIDDVGNEKRGSTKKTMKAATPVESVLLSTGKWSCNHVCSGGTLLKNGQPCKHQCCREGTDKPRKLKAKASAGTSGEQNIDEEDDVVEVDVAGKSKKKQQGKIQSQLKAFSTGPKLKNNKSTKRKFKRGADHDSELGAVELVDLADDLASVTYVGTTSRDYRKLHALHTSVQGDKYVSLPKKNPHPSNQDDLSYFQEHSPTNDLFDGGGIDDDDFPSPSRLFGEIEDAERIEAAEPTEQFQDAFESLPLPYHKEPQASSAYGDDYMEDFEDGLREFGYTEMLKQAMASKMNSSFTNPNANSNASDFFDFDAFDVTSDSPVRSTTTSNKQQQSVCQSLSSESSRKRERSLSVVSELPKRRQVAKGDEEEEEVSVGVQPFAPSTPTPAWVSEFDADLVDGLRDFVEFVD